MLHSFFSDRRHSADGRCDRHGHPFDRDARSFGGGFFGERGERGGRGFGREGRGPGFGGWARGGRERIFDGGELQLVILKLLAERASYGYELIKAIEERLAGGYAPSPGVVYPTLTLLEERGLAEVVSTEGNRKVYGITADGRAELSANQGRIDAIFERIEHSGRRFGRERSPEIMSAFRNLGEAIRARMMRGEHLSAEQVTKIAQAINDAARAIDSV